MKILLVDNGTKYLAFLEKFAADNGANNVLTLRPAQLEAEAWKNFDLTVLSGGNRFPVLGHEDYYHSEIELIKSTGKPLLGICLGCELIAHAFGCKLEKLANAEEHNWVRLEPLRTDPVISDLTQTKVYESHKWTISDLGPEIEALATSKDGYEIIRHRSRPIYGFQFHPELEPDRAALILNRLLAIKQHLA